MPDRPSRRRYLSLLAVGGLGVPGCVESMDSTPSDDSPTDVETPTDPTTTPNPTPHDVPRAIHEVLGVDDSRAPENYDGLVDLRGEEEVEVLVGADGNRGHYAFSPAAIQIDNGTTVTWRWTGEGGNHQITAIDDPDAFPSELTDEEGHTHSYTFDLGPPNEGEGFFLYYCWEHFISKGERGAIVVGPCCEQYPDPGQEGPGDTN